MRRFVHNAASIVRIVSEGPASDKTLVWELEQAAAHPRHAYRCLLRYADQQFSYAEVSALSNQLARAYQELGIEPGDVVGLMMENRPAYLFHLFALLKRGAKAALINPHTRADGLKHAFQACGAVHVVVGSECLEALAPVLQTLPNGLAFRTFVDEDPERPGVATLLPRISPVGRSRSALDTQPARMADTAAYIFTSGTTGLPKAAQITHKRLVTAGRIFGALVWRLAEDDVIYNCLPLCHSNGLFVGLASVLTQRATLALGRKFSQRSFWADVERHRATGFNYIGEMCTYLMNAPAPSSPPAHYLRRIVGQGLREELWPRFVARFAIPKVVEFYASTEGNVGIVNTRGVPGAVGKLWLGSALVRWDDEREDFVRDARGRLVRCRPGECGVLLGPISKRLPFDGYRDPQATERKIVRDAFRRGDAYFNTGDLFRVDGQRNLFFMDRLGDTYRWKGENVSTCEVQRAVAQYPGVAMVNAYGVAVPGREGRAGMVALVLAPGAAFDPRAFARHVDATLPHYARPVFARVCEQLELTSTLKLSKTALQRAGIDPEHSAGATYFRPAGADAYEQLSREAHAQVAAGELRL